ncbi:hypothetical protein M1310_02910, partial [Candidatus Marsarchaeota archaeon]|nr:hypothetical protein [Candidatus Marsarchaeota archaeon]
MQIRALIVQIRRAYDANAPAAHDPEKGYFLLHELLHLNQSRVFTITDSSIKSFLPLLYLKL